MIDNRLGKLFTVSQANIGLILNIKETPASQGEKIRKKNWFQKVVKRYE